MVSIAVVLKLQQELDYLVVAIVARVQKAREAIDDFAARLALVELSCELLVRQVDELYVAVDDRIEVTVQLW